MVCIGFSDGFPWFSFAFPWHSMVFHGFPGLGRSLAEYLAHGGRQGIRKDMVLLLFLLLLSYGFLWYSSGLVMNVFGFSYGFGLGFHGFLMVFLCFPLAFSMIFHLFYYVSMAFLAFPSVFRWFSLAFLWRSMVFYGFPGLAKSLAEYLAHGAGRA